MPVAGLVFLAFLPTAPPDGMVLGVPRLARGDELVYSGEVTEAGERIDNRFRKRFSLDVRLLVLETQSGYADCAVLTRVRPLGDPVVAGPAAAVTGANPTVQPAAAAVTVEFVRVDLRGRVVRLLPPSGPPPIPLGPTTPTRPLPSIPLDAPPSVELGLFVPLPAKAAAVGTTWDQAEPGRPPVGWAANRETVWNGCRCIEVKATQQTDGYDTPALAVAGWKRTDTLQVAATDGYASSVTRRIERREGASIVGWVELKYEMQPPTRYTESRYAAVRAEAEAAYTFAADLAPLLLNPRATPSAEFRARLVKIDRFLTDRPAPTGFRDGVEAVRRRCEAAVRGDLPTLPTAAPEPKPEPLTLGRPAPDFVAPWLTRNGQFRLSAARGSPTVLVFYKPGSKTAAGALSIAEGLHHAFPGRVTVTALSIAAGTEEATRQRDAWKLEVPLADGTTARSIYSVESYPKVFLIDAEGVLRWRFDGYGPEVGFLAKQELTKLLK